MECQDIDDFESMLTRCSDMYICCSCGEYLSLAEMHDEVYDVDHALLRRLEQQFFPSLELSSWRLCVVCHKHLYDKDQLPPYSKANGFDFGEVPPQLKDLTRHEQQLIPLVIPVFRIINWHFQENVKKLQGHVINLRNDLNEVAERLPRKPSESGIYTYQVNSHLEGRVFAPIKNRPVKVIKALQWLKVHNHLYANLEIASEDEQQTEKFSNTS